ncbi:MAG: hypothetical protein J6B45_03120 [Clostridia bacterium]|nr:hypothetical protein [Clostridia bacterium]
MKIRRTLRRFRVPIIAAISAIAVLITAFMITKGMVFGASLENIKIEYGNKPSFTANAVFSDVRYEFSQRDKDDWSEEIPVKMGDYKMRVSSKGVFGERYSREQFFSIVPRSIEVCVDKDTVTYGENPTVGASLAFTDRVECGEFVFEDTTKQSTTVTPVKEAVKVIDEKGRDVTGCYTVSVKPSTVTFTKRDITVTIGSVQTEYKDELVKHEVWEVTGGTLAYDDDIIKVVENTFTEEKNEGTFENKGELRVVRNGVDITHQYNIEKVYGAITINKRPIVIYTNSIEQVYSNEPVYDIGFEIDEKTPLLLEKGHTISVSYYPPLTKVGEMDNALGFIIRDAEGNDVTDNYGFEFHYGKISVLPREVSVKTVTESVVYNGSEYSFGKYDVVSALNLVKGHQFKIISQTKVTNAVEALENAIELDIVDENGNSVVGNYSISYEFGNVTVSKKDITITSDSLNGTYNGRAQGKETVFYDEAELCENHTLDVTYKSTVTDCLKTPVPNEFTVIIRDANGENVTENYNVNAVYGDLQLSPMPIYIITNSESKVYDGLPLKGEGFTYQSGSQEIVGGQRVEYVNAPSVTNAEYIDNVFKIKIFAGDEEKTFNYQINYEYGILNIDKRPFVITSLGFAGKVYYDGEKHRNEKYNVTAADGYDFSLVANHEVRVEFLPQSYVEFAKDGSNEQINLFNVTDIIDTVTGESVRNNYAPMQEYELLRLEKRPIMLGSGSLTVIYDGQAHYNHDCFALEVDENNLEQNMGLAPGHTPNVQFYSRAMDVIDGEVSNWFGILGILDRDGNDVYENYELKGYRYGKLKVEPRPVTLISKSATKMYDGTPLENTEYSVGGMGLVAGQTLDYINHATITDVLYDKVDNVIGIENSFELGIIGGRADNYVVTETDFGTLTVTKRPITITSQDASKVYDGEALYNDSLLIGGEGVGVGDRVEGYDFATVTDVLLGEGGELLSKQNTFDFAILKADGTSSFANYEITVNYTGELTVTKRPMEIEIDSVSREYDGTPLVPLQNGFWVEYASGKRGMLDNHAIQMSLSGSITRVGSVTIGYEAPAIFAIENGQRVDKTHNYEITVYDGSLTVTKRNIVLNARYEEQEYKGSVINPSFDASDVTHAYDRYAMGLGEGDTITVIFTSGAREELGTSTVRIQSSNGWTILNKDGEDVTDCYNVVSVKKGSLTVVPRKISIEILGNYKEYYDGAKIENNGYSVDNFLFDIGHTITMVVDGEQTNVGSSSAVLREGSIVIKDKNGISASKYYEIVGITNGTLTVDKKRPSTVTSASETFVYDGQAHKREEYTVVDNCPYSMQRAEYELVVFQNGIMVLPGAYDNMFSVKMLVVGTNEDTTDNYEITSEYGKIVIGSINIEVTTQGGEKAYDGTPLKNAGASYVCYDEIAGLEIQIITTGEQTNVGTSKNTYEIIASMNGHSFPKEGINVIKEDLGELTVTPITVTIHTESAEKTYDGTPLIHNVFTSDWEETEASKNVTLAIETPMLTDIGRRDNTFKVKLYDNEGNELPADNVIISEESTVGTLTMYADLIVIESDRDTFEYDGLPKSCPEHKAPSGHMNYYHTVQSYGFSSFIDVGEYENTFEVIIVDENGNSMMEFYPNIELRFDTVTITQREIVIKAPTVTEKYENGKILYAPNEIVIPNEDLDELNNNLFGDVYDYVIDGNMAEVAWADQLGVDVEYYIPEEFFCITLNGERVDMNNFKVICEPGYLRLSDKLVEIEVFDVDGYYDGNRLEYFEDDWDIADGQLPDGFELYLDLSGIGLSEAGVIDFDEMLEDVLTRGVLKVYRVDENGDIIEDATDLFEFKFVGNPLTLNKAELVLTAGSAKKYHDETPLTSNTYTITGGGLAEGHVIKECKVVGSITDVGREYNVIMEVVIVDMNNRNEYGNPIDVTDNYHITTEKGILEVFEDEQQ